MKASFDNKEKIKPWLSSDLKRHQKFLGKHFQFNIDFRFGIYIWNSEEFEFEEFEVKGYETINCTFRQIVSVVFRMDE